MIRIVSSHRESTMVKRSFSITRNKTSPAPLIHCCLPTRRHIIPTPYTEYFRYFKADFSTHPTHVVHSLVSRTENRSVISDPGFVSSRSVFFENVLRRKSRYTACDIGPILLCNLNERKHSRNFVGTLNAAIG